MDNEEFLPDLTPAQYAAIDRDMQWTEADELETRRQWRVLIATTQDQLEAAFKTWILDTTPDYQRFHVSGSQGHYHQTPQGTLIAILRAFEWTPAEIAKAVRQHQSPLKFMSAIELVYVYFRVQRMLNWFDRTPRGTLDDACNEYQVIGDLVRQTFYRRYGVFPEQYPKVRNPITGKEYPGQFSPRLGDETRIFIGLEEDESW